MKLKRLSVKNHLLLHDIDLNFDRSGRLDQNGSYRLDLLVGINGTGKSTLLRSLVEIFSSLSGATTVDYPYQLEYELHNNGHPLTIKIDNSASPTTDIELPVSDVFSEDGTNIDHYHGELPNEYLPENIIVYTTGYEVIWESLLNDSEEELSRSDSDQPIKPDNDEYFLKEIPYLLDDKPEYKQSSEKYPFQLLRNSRLNAITLCGFLRYLAENNSTSPHPLDSVLDSAEIERIAGFSLRLRIYDRLSDKSFFEKFQELDPKPMILQQASDRLVVFDLIKDPGTAKRLLDQFNGAFGLFKSLDAQLDDDPTHTNSPTLQEVNLFLQRKTPAPVEGEMDNSNIPSVFLLNWLSDGERAFLGRMALLAMLDTQDSLIILDEPEAHFNDFWKREIINITDQLLADKHNHIIITTHSSIMLSDITESQVVLLTKNEYGWSEQVRIHSPLLAVDPSEIMVDYFQTKKSVGAFATRYLNAALERGNYKELEQLLDQVGPGYWRYRIQNKLEELNAPSS